MGFIGKYETHEQIGAGSMGSVYRARDIVLDRDVALKILNTGGAVDPELKERFYREARAGAKLRHPNIVFVYDLGEVNGVAYIAMELLSGADLRRYIHEARPVSLNQKLEFLAQVCDGLAHAHKAGIVHRDIKPSNIFIQDDRQAKVLDFGIARMPSSKLTMVGRVLGTPNYMAPEQILTQPCDARSDIFSAAIVFFEFLVLAHPFQSTFIPRRIAEDEPDGLSERDSLIPRSLETLLQKALRKNPDDRIQTAEEFASGLRAVSQELRSELATPPGIFDPGRTSKDITPVPSDHLPTAGEGSTGWHVSDFIQLLGTFDKELLARNFPQARKSLEHMRQLEVIDGGFGQALQECEARLAEATGEPLQEPKAGPTTEAAGKSTHTWDDTKVFIIKDLNLESPPAARPEPPKPPAPVPASPPVAAKAATPPAAKPPQPPHPPKPVLPVAKPTAAKPAAAQFPPPFVSQVLGQAKSEWAGLQAKIKSLTPQQRLIAMVAGAAVVIVIAAVLFTFVRSPAVQASVGEAVVRASRAELRAPGRDKLLMYLDRDTRINVLRLPEMSDKEWVDVQVAGAKTSPPGVVRAVDLGGWTSKDPATLLSMLKLYAPGMDGNETDLRLHVANLQQFVSTYSSAPQLPEAYLHMARYGLELAARLPCSDTRRVDRLASAKQFLSSSSGEEALDQRVRLLQDECLSFAQTPPSTEVSAQELNPASAAEADCNTNMRARWRRADYNGIISLADTVKQTLPDSPCASSWESRARRAIRTREELSQ